MPTAAAAAATIGTTRADNSGGFLWSWLHKHRQAVANVATLQLCIPLVYHQYDQLAGLLTFYLVTALLLLAPRLYQSTRSYCLIAVRLLPLAAACYIACTWGTEELKERIGEGLLFYYPGMPGLHEVAGQLLGMDGWLLHQLLLPLGVAWQSTTLPVSGYGSECKFLESFGCLLLKEILWCTPTGQTAYPAQLYKRLTPN